MSKFSISVLLLMFSCGVIIADDVTDGTELLFSLLIHRHGDRTPVESSLLLSNDPITLEALSAPYGYGQLTDAGKTRAFALGDYIGRRYSELLAPRYNRSEVYIRSTDSTRTKMTILTALASIYWPAEGTGWSDKINWEPVPYTTVPAKYDFNQGVLNCPIYTNYTTAAMFTPYPELSERYSEILALLSSKLGYNISNVPLIVSGVYDVYVSQLSLGLAIDDDVAAVLDQIEELADISFDLLYGSDNYKKYQAGVLLNEFYTYSAQAIAGVDTQRLRIYSAHDANVYAFEAVTEIENRQGSPKYASAYSLEVRRVTETGEIVVLPVYQPTPGTPEIYLQVKGCGNVLCNYDRFVEITSSNALDEDTWRTECGFTNDLVIDDSSVA
ncbi:prostatic acid phosphatase-like [Achroia grisella]|uniref:prostatic acid phosphatase-like n=1 Tax=Achroia grisella TaxID=688607 RepID=UPI0027D3354E|nr:prostatic acid phosphatase-like [Achroia grisella]